LGRATLQRDICITIDSLFLQLQDHLRSLL
jgi:hypothetical protein